MFYIPRKDLANGPDTFDKEDRIAEELSWYSKAILIKHPLVVSRPSALGLDPSPASTVQ